MGRTPTDTQGTAARGRRVVTNELERRGGKVEDIRDSNRDALRLTIGGSRYLLFVKTRTSGSWQAVCTDGDPEKARSNVFWIFVDLEPEVPEFYIAPDAWVREDILRHHQAYLERYGGHRAQNDDSKHHAIQTARIERWRNRWDLLGLA